MWGQATVDYRDAVSRWRQLPGPVSVPPTVSAAAAAFQLAVSGPRQTATVLCPGGSAGSATATTLDLAEDEDDGGDGSGDGGDADADKKEDEDGGDGDDDSSAMD